MVVATPICLSAIVVAPFRRRERPPREREREQDCVAARRDVKGARRAEIHLQSATEERADRLDEAGDSSGVRLEPLVSVAAALQPLLR